VVFSLIIPSLLCLTSDLKDESGQPAPTLKQEVVKLNYIGAETVYRLLIPYQGMYTKISFDSKNNILTISDTPENLEKILAAIRKIDVKPKDMLFTVQLLIASDTENRTDPELKNDPLIKELSKFLRYKSYQVLDSALVRGVDGKFSEISLGPNLQFTLSLEPKISADSTPADINLGVSLRQVKIETVMPDKLLNWIVKSPSLDLIRSTLNLKSGDRVVVGLSRMDQVGSSNPDEKENKGLILIISGKVLD
jgi:hypothetical protein